MAEFKNQHFVPQMLLRRFAKDVDKKLVSLIHIKTEKVHDGPISDQASKDYFYGKDLVLEKSFGPVEGETMRLLDEIEAGKLPKVPSQDFQLLIFFITLQWCRTPAAAAEVNAMTDAMAKALMTGRQKRGLAPKFDLSAVNVGKKNAVSDAVKLAADLYGMLFDLRLAVLKNMTTTEFVLGDLGLAFHNQWRQMDPSQGYVGFGECGVQVLFPISPRTTIVLYDEDVYSVGTRRNPIVEIKDAEDILQLNRLQAESSSNCIYFTGHADTAATLIATLEHAAPRIESPEHRVTTSEDGASDMIHMFRRAPAVHVNIPAISLLRDAYVLSPQPGEILIREWPHELREQQRAGREER